MALASRARSPAAMSVGVPRPQTAEKDWLCTKGSWPPWSAARRGPPYSGSCAPDWRHFRRSCRSCSACGKRDVDVERPRLGLARLLPPSLPARLVEHQGPGTAAAGGAEVLAVKANARGSGVARPVMVGVNRGVITVATICK